MPATKASLPQKTGSYEGYIIVKAASTDGEGDLAFFVGDLGDLAAPAEDDTVPMGSRCQ